jgi:predicted phosphoribosyltransferase
MGYRFRDRAAAGRLLAAQLGAYARRPDVLVLALPRGGVPVGYEVARSLGAPLDVLVVRKLGVPGHEELAMGAIAGAGVRVIHPAVVAELGIPDRAIDAVAERERRELERRERAYRVGRPAPDLRGRAVVLVDDGLATGMTMRAAIEAVRRQAPAQVIVAVPVIAAQSCATFRTLADALVWVIAPKHFLAVGQWYADFTPTTDDEVRDLLADAARALAVSPDPPAARRRRARPSRLGRARLWRARKRSGAARRE